jgi:hypothetical protein
MGKNTFGKSPLDLAKNPIDLAAKQSLMPNKETIEYLVEFVETIPIRSELETDIPDFEKVQQIITSNKDVLKKPHGINGKYVLHYMVVRRMQHQIL